VTWHSTRKWRRMRHTSRTGSSNRCCWRQDPRADLPRSIREGRSPRVQEKVRKAAEKAKEEADRGARKSRKASCHPCCRASSSYSHASTKPAPPLHARNASAAIGGKACEQIRLETQEKVKKAAADVALEALDSSEHIKHVFHNERYRH